MKILMPIAVRSEFFPEQDYPFPKPLIEVANVPMIERVINNLDGISTNVKFIFVVSQKDVANFSLDKTLQLLTNNNCEIVILKAKTSGALCSCLMAISHFVDDEELLITNGDQILDIDLSESIDYFRNNNSSAGVITFDSVHPRWSYVKTDDNGQVLQAEEKKVISRNAVAGFYYFSKASVFVEAAKATIEADRHLDEIFYIAPSLNEIILSGGNVQTYKISSTKYHSFYSPTKVDDYVDYMMATGSYQSSENYENVNIIIPAAGQGSRFAKAGYEKPKPYIDVLGQAMIEHVIENVSVKNAKTTLLLRDEHIEKERELSNKFRQDGHTLVGVEKLTEGTACTVLLAREHFDDAQPMMVANSDQYVDFDCQAYVDDCINRGLDGSILVFKDPSMDPKWSFAKLDENGLVTEVAEKKAISDLATVGIYFFRRGSDFIKAAVDMIAVNERVNGEFYTCPVYNYMIKQGLRIGVYEVPMDAMHGLGTPDDLNAFLDLKNKN